MAAPAGAAAPAPAAAGPRFQLGDTVLYGSRMAVLRYLGPLPGVDGLWVGLELQSAYGNTDGIFGGHRYFQCRPFHGLFTRVANIMPYSKENRAAVFIQAATKLLLVKKWLRKAHKAATDVQRVWRSAKARKEAQELRLWRTWSLLEAKEESEMVRPGPAWDELKSKLEKLKPAMQQVKRERERIPQVQGVVPVHEDEDKTPRLPDPITLDFVTAAIDHFKAGGLLRPEDVSTVIDHVHTLLEAENNIVLVPVHTKVTVVGDIHGQFDDLLTIFNKNGLPSLRNTYIFNGDFVDRGPNSVECVTTMLLFKMLYPSNVFLNRGNHEARDINGRDGFEREVLIKYGSPIFDQYVSLFSVLPLACIIDSQIFVVHGGLFWTDVTLREIAAIDRVCEVVQPDSLMEQMLWSDPQLADGRQFNSRGASLTFGGDVVRTFLEQNKLSMIVRSHELKREGFEFLFDNKLLTVFSCSNYCGVMDNKGAFVIFERDLVPHVVQYEARPKEKMPRLRMRHAALTGDVISKLIARIAQNRLALLDYYQRRDARGEGLITRREWAEGLRAVLQLSIPFLEFQTYLGLPKLGRRGDDDGRVDYATFLDRYRLQIAAPAQRAEGQPQQPPPQPLPQGPPPKLQRVNSDERKSREAPSLLERLIEVLHRNQFELETLFLYFDINGDGMISVAEFREGLRCMQAYLKEPVSDESIDAFVSALDTNKDGSIQYEEFFRGFELADPELARAAKRRHIFAQPAVPPPHTPSPQPQVPSPPPLPPPPPYAAVAQAPASASAPAPPPPRRG